ncbi:hypothetical protein CK203_088351 [Vitis vinifera]|uniref:Uncharacterized protein n=1 Tax=Vitis vinifera TaxID=29760 RepID=A0A438DNZ6_VITVI|nr:hypothetical protein CK203_088351 [Vitis vinifera]
MAVSRVSLVVWRSSLCYTPSFCLLLMLNLWRLLLRPPVMVYIISLSRFGLYSVWLTRKCRNEKRKIFKISAPVGGRNWNVSLCDLHLKNKKLLELVMMEMNQYFICLCRDGNRSRNCMCVDASRLGAHIPHPPTRCLILQHSDFWIRSRWVL